MEKELSKKVEELKFLQNKAIESAASWYKDLTTPDRITKLALARITIDFYDRLISAIVYNNEKLIEELFEERKALILVAAEILLGYDKK